MNFEDLAKVGPVDFYGVDNNMFRVGVNGEVHTFEVLEDESDGYRSMLGTVEARGNDGVFSAVPFARVTVRKFDEQRDVYDRGYTRLAEGWELIDDAGHTWLSFGTDDHDDYYPCFFFDYQPAPPPSNEPTGTL